MKNTYIEGTAVDSYLNSIPGYEKRAIPTRVNAYDAICEVCRKIVPAGTGIRITVKGAFSNIHKVRHKECEKVDHLFVDKEK